MDDDVAYSPPSSKAVNHNISSKSPLLDFIQLSSAFLFVLFLAYHALGVSAEYVAENHHKKVNNLFSNSPDIFLNASGSKSESIDSADYKKLNKVFSRIVSANGLEDKNYTLHLIDSTDLNAYAAPGGHIFVLRGFLDSIDSENELAFVLSHELAHHENKDAIKGLGRGLALFFISSIFTGTDSIVSGFFSSFINLATSSYSQAQETDADRLGLKFLNKAYSHVGGAKDFFNKMKSKESFLAKYSIFKTHPASADRVERMEIEIEKQGYRVQKRKKWK